MIRNLYLLSKENNMILYNDIWIIYNIASIFREID